MKSHAIPTGKSFSERRAGMLGLAKEIGEIKGTQSHIVEQVKKISENTEQLTSCVRNLEETMRDVPRETHSTDHIFIDELRRQMKERAEAEKRKRELFESLITAFGKAVAANAARALWLLIFAAILALLGATGLSDTILAKALSLIGGN